MGLKRNKYKEKPSYTGDTTPTVIARMRHQCHIPRTAKDGRVYQCMCGKKFRYNGTEGLGVEL